MSATRKRKKARRKTKRAASSGVAAGGARLGVLLLRLWAGGFFLTTGVWKLTDPELPVGEMIAYFRDQEYVQRLTYAIQNPPEILGRPLHVYAEFLEHVMLPARGVFAPGILFFEVLLGACLVLGLGVRLLAGLGVVMMLAFNFVKLGPGAAAGDPVGVPLFTVHSSNWPVTLILLLLVLAAAGRFLGLDAWLRARGPAWLRWVG